MNRELTITRLAEFRPRGLSIGEQEAMLTSITESTRLDLGDIALPVEKVHRPRRIVIAGLGIAAAAVLIVAIVLPRGPSRLASSTGQSLD
jgi:hypothetical protein